MMQGIVFHSLSSYCPHSVPLYSRKNVINAFRYNCSLYNKLHRYPHLVPYRSSQMTKSITGPMHSASQFLYSHNSSHQCDKCLLPENGHPGFVMSFDKCRLARDMAAAAAI